MEQQIDEKEKLNKKQKLDDKNQKIIENNLIDEYNQIDGIQNQLNEEEIQNQKKKQKQIIEQRRDCPYISTIKRHMLDFDFEKVCSVSSSNVNIYACLVCGKYFQGRSKNTHAYTHCLEEQHHIFINLKTSKIYCLPDNYEVIDTSLNDIKFYLSPQFSMDSLSQIVYNKRYYRSLNGNQYMPGFIGMNNLNKTDYFNVIFQSLSVVEDFRNFFLLNEIKEKDLFDINCLLYNRTTELIRKIWSDKNFKGHVSPHELVQGISLKSNKKFSIGNQSNPLDLLIWFLNNLEKEYNQSFKSTNKSNIIDQCFRGQIEVHTYQPQKGENQVGYEKECTTQSVPFLFLQLDIPPAPLYKNDQGKIQIANMPIFNLLSKYDSKTFHDDPKFRKLYKIKKLPKYLIFHYKRFIQNKFFIEKNSTIVSFPLNNLDLSQYFCLENDQKNQKYDLITNICHEGTPDEGFYKIHVRNKYKNEWYEIQDLLVQEKMAQLVCVSETFIQIWERQEKNI